MDQTMRNFVHPFGTLQTMDPRKLMPLPGTSAPRPQVVSTSKRLGFGGAAEIDVLTELKKGFPGIPGLQG